jgi:hypothetical protein
MWLLILQGTRLHLLRVTRDGFGLGRFIRRILMALAVLFLLLLIDLNDAMFILAVHDALLATNVLLGIPSRPHALHNNA